MDPITISYLTKVAATLTSSLLQAAGGKLQKTILGTEQEKALQQAVRDGLVALLLTAGAVNQDEEALLTDIFQAFFGHEDVAPALAGLLRGQTPDYAELGELFADMGFVADQLPGLDFAQGMRAFVGTFMESADGSPPLQGAIKTGLLRTQVGLSRETLATIRELLEFLRQAKEETLALRGNSICGRNNSGGALQLSFRLDNGAGDPSAERFYLRTMRGACDHLDLINFDETHPDQHEHLKISQVFTGLLVQNLQYGPKDDLAAVIRQQRQPTSDLVKRDDIELRPVSVIQAVAAMERLVILGRPGSGKSTLVNHLASQLAGQKLGVVGSDAIPGWQGAPLLPVRIILRRFAAWPGLSGPGQAGLVWQYLEQMLKEDGCGEAFAAIRRELQDGGGIVFFDGLDEVPETVDQQKRSCIMAAIKAFSEPLDKCKIIVTCREYAYRNNNGWRLPEALFPVVQLADFNDKQIADFAGAWYRAVGPLKMWSEARRAEEAAGLVQALRELPHLRELAGSPLLLTIMAQLHGRPGSLPRDRAELYRRAVLALLALWENRIIRDREGNIEPGQVAQLGVRVEHLHLALAKVAFLAHQRQQQEAGGPLQAADIPRAELREVLGEELKDFNKAQEVIEYIEKRAGLLTAKGDSTYCFPHRTFQEYLAASHILKQGDPAALLRGLVKGAPDWWREVFLLAAGTVNVETPKMVSDLVDELVPAAPGNNGCSSTQHPIICLAGLALAETDSAARVAKELAHSSDGGRFSASHHRLQDWLEKAMFARDLPLAARAEAGQVLGRLGDHRPGVGLRLDGLPDMRWCEVAAGPFLMGSTAETAKYDDEKEQFSCSLIQQPFQIGRYPVTVAQFRAFIAAKGYENERYWSEAGWQWRNQRNISGPEGSEDRFRIANHPQVGVSWFEALAFCNWLSEVSGEAISLPTEAQWERVARAIDGRLYPWGEGELDPAHHANIFDADLHGTSAVGLFPAGEAVCGALDCAGNVWEWCRTIWLKDYADYERKVADDLKGVSLRVVRGGSWDYDRGTARCASRLRLYPGFRYSALGFRCARAVK